MLEPAQPSRPMQRAGRALAENWRLVVLVLIVGATSFAGAFVVSGQSRSSDSGANVGEGGTASVAPQAPPRTPGQGGVAVPEQIGSFEELHAVAVEVVGGPGPPDGGYGQYVEWTSANGEITVEVPVVWGSEQSPPWLDEDSRPIGVSVLATPEVTRFYQAWDTPGLFLGASRQIAEEGPDALLDRGRRFHAQSCLAAGRGDLETDGYIGRYEVWYDCAQSPTTVLSVAMRPRDPDDVLVAIYMKLTTVYDLDALERVLQTFEVNASAVE